VRKVLFLALSVTFLFVHEISTGPVNGFAPNSQGRRVWSLARTCSNVKVKGQGYQAQKRGFQRISRELLNGFETNSHGRRVWCLIWTSLKVKVKVNFGGLRAVYVWKNIFALVLSISTGPRRSIGPACVSV